MEVASAVWHIQRTRAFCSMAQRSTHPYAYDFAPPLGLVVISNPTACKKNKQYGGREKDVLPFFTCIYVMIRRVYYILLMIQLIKNNLKRIKLIYLLKQVI